MSSSNRRTIEILLVCIAACIFFFSLSRGHLAQSKLQIPAPTSHVTDLTGVLDDQTKERLENILANVALRSKIQFYLALVQTTGGQDIFEFSRQLARQWDIGARTTAKKSLLLVVSVDEKTAFTQFSRSVQNDLPDGILGDLSQRISGPIAAGRFKIALNNGIDQFVNGLAKKLAFSLEDIDRPVAVAAMQTPVPTAEPTPEPTAQPTPEPTAQRQPRNQHPSRRPRSQHLSRPRSQRRSQPRNQHPKHR
jgi:uncharacterized membrane protein YgcG